VPNSAIKSLTEEQVDRIIQMAWCDRTSFETIRERTSFTEPDVIQLMRAKLKRKSFNLWRKRVSGRTTKHRKRFRREQKSIHRPSTGW
jgi:uncharacterized protein (TIGR03643 family)